MAKKEDVIKNPEPESSKKPIYEGYKRFVYVGPALPGGKLKNNAILIGKFADIMNHYKDVFEEFPQAAKLIFPVEQLGKVNSKVKSTGNIVNKYYNEIISIMNKNKEV